MADPFSILVGVAGLADVIVRLGKILKNAKEGCQTVDEDLDSFSREIETLRAIHDQVDHTCQELKVTSVDYNQKQRLINLCTSIKDTVNHCNELALQLAQKVTEISTSDKGRLLKWLKQQSKEPKFKEIRRKLSEQQKNLHISLASVNIILTSGSHAISKEACLEISRLGTKISCLETTITENDLKNERRLKFVAQSVKQIVPIEALNKHFYIGKAVSSNYTGRSRELDVLKQYFITSPSNKNPQGQKRFVVTGLSGSGKTQFCCKFASENKQRYWGVFWIDASSKENAKQSFSTISALGKVAPNQDAAKSWLSGLGPDQPWLLIIDNADDESFLDSCFPDGKDGSILITTRNPAVVTYGTVGDHFCRFEGLGGKESIELLLKAANVPRSDHSIEHARNISEALGHLPIALEHAGKAILTKFCTLETYLDDFNENWDRIRFNRSLHDSDTPSDENAAIYRTYELLHDDLENRKTRESKDALDLLKIFSFFHHQRIRLDIFSYALLNPTIETEHQKRKAEEETSSPLSAGPKTTWSLALRNSSLRIYNYIYQLGYRPAVPSFLCAGPDSKNFDEFRLRKALKELSQRSLVSSISDSKCYSVHPAVHLWVRNRPKMALHEQALWCHMSASILSRAILIPAIAEKEEDEIFRRDLLPHVLHVQKTEQTIKSRYERNQSLRHKRWPVLQQGPDRDHLLRMVKFSIVLMQGDILNQAEQLQVRVKDFALRRLGIEHPTTMDIMRLLSKTYWLQTRGDDAADLQREVLVACIRVRGESDLKTLQVMDEHGSSLWLQGRYSEACKVHEAAVKGFRKVTGEKSIQTLKAKGGLGRAVGKDFRFSEAITIHNEVFAGLEAKYGRDHLDTIEAKDNLAMAYYDRAAFGYGQPGDLDNALQMELEVFELRKEKLGREHLRTLWSGLNLSKVRAVRGEVDEALATFLPGHEIARRNLGEEHFGYLLGKVHYGRILICAKRYEEAEKMLSEAVASYDKARQRHADRLLGMFSLIKCRNLLGMETTDLLRELTESTKALFGPEHLAVKYLTDPEELSKESSSSSHQPTKLSDNVAVEFFPVEDSNPIATINKYGHI